jgi:hypothetical protein
MRVLARNDLAWRMQRNPFVHAGAQILDSLWKLRGQIVPFFRVVRDVVQRLGGAYPHELPVTIAESMLHGSSIALHR